MTAPAVSVASDQNNNQLSFKKNPHPPSHAHGEEDTEQKRANR